ncbi:hypothetical protein TRVL_03781 [Trypanosoma vivax]|nr:hypothetical protein TRVL_03781 [Trypanosoma vivax]
MQPKDLCPLTGYFGHDADLEDVILSSATFYLWERLHSVTTVSATPDKMRLYCMQQRKLQQGDLDTCGAKGISSNSGCDLLPHRCTPSAMDGTLSQQGNCKDIRGPIGPSAYHSTDPRSCSQEVAHCLGAEKVHEGPRDTEVFREGEQRFLHVPLSWSSPCQPTHASCADGTVALASPHSASSSVPGHGTRALCNQSLQIEGTEMFSRTVEEAKGGDSRQSARVSEVLMLGDDYDGDDSCGSYLHSLQEACAYSNDSHSNNPMYACNDNSRDSLLQRMYDICGTKPVCTGKSEVRYYEDTLPMQETSVSRPSAVRVGVMGRECTVEDISILSDGQREVFSTDSSLMSFGGCHGARLSSTAQFPYMIGLDERLPQNLSAFHEEVPVVRKSHGKKIRCYQPPSFCSSTPTAASALRTGRDPTVLCQAVNSSKVVIGHAPPPQSALRCDPRPPVTDCPAHTYSSFSEVSAQPDLTGAPFQNKGREPHPCLSSTMDNPPNHEVSALVRGVKQQEDDAEKYPNTTASSDPPCGERERTVCHQSAVEGNENQGQRCSISPSRCSPKGKTEALRPPVSPPPSGSYAWADKAQEILEQQQMRQRSRTPQPPNPSCTPPQVLTANEFELPQQSKGCLPVERAGPGEECGASATEGSQPLVDPSHVQGKELLERDGATQNSADVAIAPAHDFRTKRQRTEQIDIGRPVRNVRRRTPSPAPSVQEFPLPRTVGEKSAEVGEQLKRVGKKGQ